MKNGVNKKFNLLVVNCISLLVLGCHNIPKVNAIDDVSSLRDSNTGEARVFFTHAKEDILLENKNRRKWDNAVIADLDRDGYQDLLLTDHGYAIKVYWNNNGMYKKGIDILVGDTHGITVGDFDKDGRQDVIVSRGGGSGSNARNAKLFHVGKDRTFTEGEEFNVPLKNMRGRTAKFVDGDNDGDLDLILMGFPNATDKEAPSYIYENDGKGQFKLANSLPKTLKDGQKMLVTDFNNDGIHDFILYGEGLLSAHQGNGDLSYTNVTHQWFIKGIEHVTSIAEIDMDNDGDFDLYLTRGKPLLSDETFYDEETERFAFYTKRRKFIFDDLVIGEVFSLKNYQSSWPNQDIFIGESAYPYEHIGEYHSGQDIKLVSSNALGWPDKRDKKGLYVGYIGNDTWRVSGHTWSPTTGVVEGVKSYKAYKHNQGVADLLLENRGNQFIDISKKSGLSLVENSEGVAIGDYDNNGYQDIFIVKQGDLSVKNNHHLFLNSNNGVFNEVSGHNIVSSEPGVIGLGAESFDYNQDGKLDIIYGSDRGKWQLYKNRLVAKDNANFSLIKVSSSKKNNVSALGSLVTLNACGKLYNRRIGSSSALYSQSFDNIIHVGLGDCDAINEVSIRWSNGEVLSKTNIAINTLIALSE